MRSSKSKARSHVEIRGLVLLYATTLEARGYRPSVVLAYSAAVEHFISWAGPWPRSPGSEQGCGSAFP